MIENIPDPQHCCYLLKFDTDPGSESMIEKIWIRDGKKSDPESGKTSRIRNTVVIFFCLLFLFVISTNLIFYFQ